MPKPQSSDAVEAQQAIKRYWAPQFTKDDLYRSIADNTHDIKIQDTNADGSKRPFPAVVAKTGTGPRDVRTLKQLYAVPAKITLDWQGEGSRSDEKSDSLEKALAVYREKQNPVGNSPRLRSVGNLIVAGRAPRGFLAGSDFWFDAPQYREKGYGEESDADYNKRRAYWEKKAPVPIWYSDLSPWTTFPVSLSRIEDEVVSYGNYTWAELADIFSPEELTGAGAPPSVGKEWHNNCVLAIYATREVVQYFVMKSNDWNPSTSMPESAWRTMEFTSADQLREIEHGLGKVPIRFASLEGTAREPGSCWDSIFGNGVAELIQLMDGRYSDVNTAVKRAVHQPLKAWLNQPGAGDSWAARIQREFTNDIWPLDNGDIATGQQREDIETMLQYNGAADAMTLIQDQRQLIAESTGVTDFLSGGLDVTAGTAWAYNLKVQIGIKGLSLLTAAVAGMDLEDMEMALRCIAKSGENLVLKSDLVIRARSEDEQKELLDWIPTIESEYKPQLASDTQTQMQLGMAMMEASLREQNPIPIPLDMIMQNQMGIDQPFDAIKDWVKWKTLLSSPYMDALQAAALAEADVIANEDEYISMREYQQKWAGQNRIPQQGEQFIAQKFGGQPTNGAMPPTNVPFSTAAPSVAGAQGMPM